LRRIDDDIYAVTKKTVQVESVYVATNKLYALTTRNFTRRRWNCVAMQTIWERQERARGLDENVSRRDNKLTIL